MSDPSPMDRPIEEQADSDRWFDWPCCPSCAKRRQTFCPTCDLADDDFRLAEYMPVSEPIGAPGSEPERTDSTVAPSQGCCGGGSCGGATSSSDSGYSDGSPADGPADETEHSLGASAEATLPILLFCPACSEAFSPVFYRLCAQCGYDFGEGREIELPRQNEMNNRVLIALLVLGGLAVGLFAYFWILFR